MELAHLAERRGATHIAVRAGKVGVGRNAFAAEVAYPLIFVPDEAARFAPPEIILGLSRQESEFNPRAYSRAGARGLMQLPADDGANHRAQGRPQIFAQRPSRRPDLQSHDWLGAPFASSDAL
ncbi:MAG: transglycosylase SLT domain-containing protein [Parvularculaceae bacterium]